ncbi:bidirectional sugar transporter SWEET14-like [Typha angustifolia]|uniref:bidirectional sugar transporter SWEET14-like n=1 Tax=Typha angustifolia TaxID=59011 RepID=UPI003C2FDE1F
MAGLSLDQPLVFTFGILGNVISFMVFLAPIPTFYQIYQAKSTKGFQSVPYIVALFSAMLWFYYAFVKTDAVLLITINSAGCFIETIYIIMYLIYAPRKSKITTFAFILLLNVVAFSLIILFILLLVNGSNREKVMGWICVAFSTSVFVAPLSIMRLVVRTKSVEFMPFSLSFFLTLSAVCWFLYGLFAKDLYVQLPNIVGFGFGVFQMLLYWYYRKKRHIIKPEQPKHGDKLEATEMNKIDDDLEAGRQKNDHGNEEGKDKSNEEEKDISPL